MYRRWPWKCASLAFGGGCGEQRGSHFRLYISAWSLTLHRLFCGCKSACKTKQNENACLFESRLFNSSLSSPDDEGGLLSHRALLGLADFNPCGLMQKLRNAWEEFAGLVNATSDPSLEGNTFLTVIYRWDSCLCFQTQRNERRTGSSGSTGCRREVYISCCWEVVVVSEPHQHLFHQTSCTQTSWKWHGSRTDVSKEKQLWGQVWYAPLSYTLQPKTTCKLWGKARSDFGPRC